jgi:hypothetical protein
MGESERERGREEESIYRVIERGREGESARVREWESDRASE